MRRLTILLSVVAVALVVAAAGAGRWGASARQGDGEDDAAPLVTEAAAGAATVGALAIRGAAAEATAVALATRAARAETTAAALTTQVVAAEETAAALATQAARAEATGGALATEVAELQTRVAELAAAPAAPTAAADATAPAEASPVAAARGQVVRAGALDLVVTDVALERAIGDAEPRGVWVVVRLTATVAGTEAVGWHPEWFAIRDDRDRRYPSDFGATDTLALADPDGALTRAFTAMQPGLPYEAALAFDVPPAATGLALVPSGDPTYAGVPGAPAPFAIALDE